MLRMTGSDCAVMYNLINTHTHTQATREVGKDRSVAHFPFFGARIYVSPVWPWWDFMGYWWDVWGWVRWHRPSPARSGQQRASSHGGARGQS